MQRFRIPALVLAALLVTTLIASWGPTAAVAAVTDPSTGTGALLFQDDFTGAAGSKPDPSRWQDYSSCAYNSSAAFGSITCGNNETLDGAGHLIVPATPTAGSGIRTGSLFSFTYGTMSAWIELPAQAGYWPAFWSLNGSPDGSGQRPIGEIDTMEAYTTWLDTSHASGHSYAPDGSEFDAADSYCAQGSGVDLSAGYHKYSARVEPGKITYFVDDVQCGSVYTKTAGKAWGFGPDVTRGNWLILDLAVGGAGGQQKPATAAARMLVDRVEVRALPPAPTMTTPSVSPSPAPSSPTPTPTPTPTNIVRDKTVYRLVNACGGKVLGVPGGSTANEVALQTGVWAGLDSQRWRVVSVGSGFFKLVNVKSGRSANVAYNSQADGAIVIQYIDVAGPNAQWSFTKAAGGGTQITARSSGKALDVRGAATSAGATIDQRGPAAGCAESWDLVAS